MMGVVMRVVIRVVIIILALSTSLAGTPDCVRTHVGTFKGTARNAAGPLQLEGAATTTIFTLSVTADSLYLRALAAGGQERTIAAWPLTRVICAGEMLKANGATATTTATTGPLHLRRTMMWNLKGGIRAEATVSTKGSSQPADDFFGGSEVQLTLLKVR